MNIKHHDAARRKALADATAGVIGSLVSMLAFYPVDVWKTSLQAGVTTNSDRGKAQSSNGDTSDERNGNSLENDEQGTSTITKMLLTAFSAVMNTCITLPLDTISSRIQAGTSNRTHNKKIDSDKDMTVLNVNGNDRHSFERKVSDGYKSARSSFGEDDDYHSANEEQVEEAVVSVVEDTTATSQQQKQLYIKSPEKFKFSFSTNLAEEAYETRKHTAPGGNNEISIEKRLHSILSLWNGILPATLLCTNPAIQYTMYDTLKNALLQHRHDDKLNSQNQQSQSNRLSMWESFVFGLISKFFATATTYPLIRAKVLLMVSPPEAFDDVQSATENGNANGCTSNRGTDDDVVDASKHPRKEGIRGIYRGCSLQLLHTVLKSALLMMVREKITVTSHRFFRVEDAS
ncbi:predicted protein [Thalassiosira pseudonana CCMP1335]|uniref:Uncharacterized protein n=1 Tax=Thalassiosira pseudonana TaxID=35128 RepID=B8BYV2_THAPS|nr:predicted protein [Thalassiosira pseudonana CCMP1335]EED93952.1 predicted protein [Thalassiosira pseudonana CCMP1335]